MLHKTSLLLLLLLIMINAEAQKIKSPPAKVNTASASNLKLHKKLDSIFSSFNKTTPGVAVTVIQNGKVIAKKAYGMANIENQVPFTHQSVVKMPYSESREFISIAAVLMEKDGIFSLNDKVRKYFPRIMEKASGQNLPVWMTKRLFEPLQMKRTSMQKNPLDIIPNQATMYENAVGGRYQLAHVPKTSPGGNYYILTSADDLELWTAIVNDPTSEISVAIHKLTTNVRQIPGKEKHYVIGYTHRSIDNQQVILHEGVNGYNYLTRVPSKGLSVITLGNKHDDGFAEQNKAIIGYFLKQAPEETKLISFITKPIEIPEIELAKYTGNFRWQNHVSWEGTNQPRKFSSLYIVDGKLMMRYTGNYIIELTPVAKDIFYYKEGLDGYGAQFQFKQASQDALLHLTVTFDDGYPNDYMVRDMEDVWQPTNEDLTDFTGRFYSEHLDYYWNIELNEAGKLILTSSNLPDTELDPDGMNQFHFIGEKYPGAGYDRWILFTKNKQGVITHLTAWSGRVMHHKFGKVQ